MAEGICVPSFLLNSEMSEEGDGGRIRPDAVDPTSYSWEELVSPHCLLKNQPGKVLFIGTFERTRIPCYQLFGGVLELTSVAESDKA